MIKLVRKAYVKIIKIIALLNKIGSQQSGEDVFENDLSYLICLVNQCISVDVMSNAMTLGQTYLPTSNVHAVSGRK